MEKTFEPRGPHNDLQQRWNPIKDIFIRYHYVDRGLLVSINKKQEFFTKRFFPNKNETKIKMAK